MTSINKSIIKKTRSVNEALVFLYYEEQQYRNHFLLSEIENYLLNNAKVIDIISTRKAKEETEEEEPQCVKPLQL